MLERAEDVVAAGELARPASHPDVDPDKLAELTPDTLIERCAHFAMLAAINPELGQQMAARALQAEKEVAEMRQQGMDAEMIRSNLFAGARQRLKDKLAETKETPSEERTVPQVTAAGVHEQPALVVTKLQAEATPFRLPDIPIVLEKIAAGLAIPATREEQAATMPPAAAKFIRRDSSSEAKRVEPTKKAPEYDHDPAEVAEAATAISTEAISDADATDSSKLEVPRMLELDAPEAPILPSPLEQPAVEAVITQPPVELYESFTQSLYQAIESTASEPEPEMVPPVVAVVAKRLDELTPKIKEEIVAPLLQEIVTTIQTITTAESANELEVVEMAGAQLEAQVAELLDCLGIKCEQETIDEFIQVLLRLDFQPSSQPDQGAAAIDLEHDGMHEAKIHWPQPASILATLELDINHLLGKFAVHQVRLGET